MKLDELLGAELYAQVKAKIDEANANEPDKVKHIRYADLSEGEYVRKIKHDDLQTKFDSQAQELTNANQLIEQLKKATKTDEGLQQKISDYETENQRLQEELKKTKLKSAVKVALMSEKVVDVDYLTYKLNESLKEKGETLELDENDNIKGWTYKLAGLKTQFPNMFGSGDGGNGYKPLDPNKLPNNNYDKTVTKEQFAKMTYEERVKLKQANEERYKQLAGKKERND